VRRLLTRLVRWLAEALVRLYYPIRAVEGAERAPASGPVIFVLNHPNGLLDPLLLRIALGRPARFLAKSTLFGNPFGRLAMDAFDTIPIFRAKEAKPGDAARNDASFAVCRAELSRGGALALFPEGVSHSDSQLRPLKTGAARIALSAEAEQDGKLGVTVVPVGLYYERKARFRSSVLLVVGSPIAIAPRLDGYRADERAAVGALTETIDARLDEVVLQAESRELLIGIARVARWMAAPHEAPDDLAAQHERAREMAAAYGRMRARDPARVEAIAAEARAYARALRRLGVRDPWALELAALRPGVVLGALAKLVVAAPVAAIGALLGWIPYRLAGRVAERITRDGDEDILGTVKLIAGATFLAIAWTAEAIAAGVVWGASWAPLAFALALGSGYVALWFEEEAHEAAAAWRTLALRAFYWRTAQQLTARRRALAEAITTALADCE
jgi:glycerol-3-phosphate O-acyltransferase/dihydroxyacetone phosphate acyltransferase